MKSKIIKIFLAFTIIITLFNVSSVYADDWYEETAIDANDPSQNPDAWKPTLEEDTSVKYSSTVRSLIGYINVIGVVISVIVLIVIGIKYLLGSVEEKAEYKKTMMGYLIGALLLFSTTTIANILYNIGISISQ